MLLYGLFGHDTHDFRLLGCLFDFLFDNGRKSGIRFKKQSVRSGIFLIFDIFFIRLKVGMSWFRFECHKRSVFSFCKVFQKNTTRRTTDKGWRFFWKPIGLDLARSVKNTEIPLHSNNEPPLRAL